MSAVLKPRFTLAEYLVREEVASHKSEFYRGQIFAMSGGTPLHSEIGGNVFASLRGRLRGLPCRPYNTAL